ncbi:MAG: T9SS type A sorting domain-containing protein [Bacteroidales bacterium]|nr:T9SS type A sorting domain-containing protein [Bacteroidales bacterium]
MRTKSVFITALMGISFIIQAHATSWYVDNTATGAGNGTSWADAWQSFADINWGAVNPGDVIFISGGSAEKTYNEQLSVDASGSEGNPITIKVGQDAGHNGKVIITNDDAGIGGGLGIRINLMSHITMDGNVNGEKKILVHHCAGAGIHLYYSHHIRLTYLDIYHNGGEADWRNSGVIVHVNEYLEPKPMIEISHCYISSNWQDGISLFGPPAPGFGYAEIHHNEILPVDDGIETGMGGVDFYNNHIHTRVYEGGLGHTDGIAFNGAEYYRVFNNRFHGFKGGTAYINFEPFYNPGGNPASRPGNQVYIYNNIMYEEETVPLGRVPAYHTFRINNPYRGSCPDGLYDEDDAKLLFNHIVEMGYLGVDYFITDNFFGLNDYSEMILDPFYEDQKESIFNILDCYRTVGSSLSGIELGGNDLSTTSLSGIIIANNVMVNLPSGGLSMGFNNHPAENLDKIIIANNIIHNCYTNGGGTAVNLHHIGDNNLAGSVGSGAEIIFDNNIISSGSNGSSAMGFNGHFMDFYSDFTDIYGLNIHGAHIDPSLDSEYKPDDINDPTVDAGLDLSDFFTIDFNGVSRSQGAWDIGAYEYPSGTNRNNELSEKQRLYKLYPNPARSSIHLESYDNTPLYFELYTITGIKFLQQKTETTKQSIDISNIPEGIYVYRAYSVNDQHKYGILMIKR